MTDTFSTWLNSRECFNDLLPCARLVIRRAEQLGITLDDSYMENGNVQEYQSAVASDLWQFIKEEAKGLNSKASNFLATRDLKGLATFISREFLDGCIDQRRNDSPFHAYYRHMRTVLSEAESINYKPLPRKGSYYAWSHKPGLAFLPDDHDFRTRHLNYNEWASSDISFSEIHKQASMIQLSHHYWDEALRIFLDEYLHPIRDLVTFVAMKFPLVPTVKFESNMDDGVDVEGLKPVLGDSYVKRAVSGDDESWMHQLPVLGQSIIEIEIEKIARDCVSRFDDYEKIVLCDLDLALSPSEIAAKLGKKGTSSVTNYKQSAIKKLRTAWSLWNLPDSEHYSVAEDELRIFVKKVIEICKEANDCRDSRKEGNL